MKRCTNCGNDYKLPRCSKTGDKLNVSCPYCGYKERTYYRYDVIERQLRSSKNRYVDGGAVEYKPKYDAKGEMVVGHRIKEGKRVEIKVRRMTRRLTKYCETKRRLVVRVLEFMEDKEEAYSVAEIRMYAFMRDEKTTGLTVVLRDLSRLGELVRGYYNGVEHFAWKQR